MAGGFSFCGTDISTYGLNYAPELEDVYVYKPAEAQSHIETFEGHNGGYFYGSWYSPKEFTLRCYFEDSRIDKGIMSYVYALFKVGRSGKLIFDRRPWCYYYATVTDPVDTDFTNYENGVITIHMKAMYPFARSNIKTRTRTDKYYDTLMTNSAVFDRDGMDKDLLYTNISLTTPNTTTIPIANPGQETAALGIAVAGNAGQGVIIANKTTGQNMKLVGFSKRDTSDLNPVQYVMVDPISGKTTIGNENGKELAFLYHEYGFLSLASSFPAIRNIYITYTSGSDTITVTNILKQDVVGKYIFVYDNWYKINSQTNEHKLKISESPTKSGTERTMIMTMNEIVIKPVSSIDLTSIEFVFKPTYA